MMHRQITDDDLLRGAELLERDAAMLRESHTLNGTWFIGDGADAQAKVDHDENLRLAKRFRDAVARG